MRVMPVRRVFKKRNLILGRESSFPSNVHWLCSLQIHHVRHAGSALQTFTYLQTPLTPSQDFSMASTEFGITQLVPTRQNMNAHRSCTKGQCSSKWLTDSPSDNTNLPKGNPPPQVIGHQNFSLGRPPKHKKKLLEGKENFIHTSKETRK